MKLKDILKTIENEIPLSLQCDWDHSGLQCGNRNAEIKKVMIAVDATDAVISQAVEQEVDLLLTHHPLIFKSVRDITDTDPTGRKVLRLVENHIACYSMHTNYDVKWMGTVAALKLKLTNITVLEQTEEYENEKVGIGAVGLLQKQMTLSACAEEVKKAFHVDAVRVYGDLKKKIKVVAICPGSGKGMAEMALEKSADVLITGDIGHHDGLDATEEGLAIIDAGHYGIEKIYVEGMKNFVKKAFPELVIAKSKNEEPFVTI